MLKKFPYRKTYLFGLLLLAAALPLGKFFMSVAQFVILGSWLLDWDWKSKLERLKSNKIFVPIFLFYLVVIIGVFYSENKHEALRELKVKLPLLAIPVLMLTSAPLSKKEFHLTLKIFVSAVAVACLFSIAAYLGFTKKKITNYRDISVFNSHIRFALCIVMSICIAIYLAWQNNKALYWLVFILHICLGAFVLVLLQSISGFIILSCVFVSYIIWLLIKKARTTLRVIVLFLVVTLVYKTYSIFKYEYKVVESVNPIDLSKLETKTANGSPYFHNLNSLQHENGNRVELYFAPNELRREWGKRSRLSLEDSTKNKNLIIHTLMRYLSSKGLRKDSIGVSKLSSVDVKNVENGFSNYLYVNPLSIRTRLHEVLWELQYYKETKNPTGHSLTMRFEFWKTASHIIKRNLVFGVGTGDAQLEFNKQYDIDQSVLSQNWRLRSHNQFLAIMVAFGLIGLFVFIIYILSPIFLVKRKHILYAASFIIIFFSYLTEDTLESQAGVSFVAFFSTLFLFPVNDEEIKKPELE